MTDFTPHPFLPMRAVGLLDPNVCASAGCGQVWNAVAHQPSLYLAAQESRISEHHAVIEEAARKAAKGAGVPPALLHTERASDGPSDGAPATHTGRPAMHSGQPRPLVIMCPMGSLTPTDKQCQFVATVQETNVHKHLIQDHAYSEEAASEYLADPWYVHEPRSAWKDRTFHRRYGNLGALLSDMGDGLKHLATVQDSDVWEVPAPGDAKAAQAALASLKVEAVHVPLGAPKCPKDGCELTHPHLHSKAEMAGGDPLDNYCEHPNGFGVNGCPCGAVAPDEDAPRMFRNIDTGKDEYAIRCPATLDHAYDVYPVSQMVRHLGRDHGWSQERIDDWAESTGVATQSLIPDPLVEDMAQRTQRQAELDDFLNPAVTLEDLMTDAEAPEELNFHTWWVAMADREAPTVQRKAEEYGTNSLVEMGRIWARAQDRDVTDLEAVEIGCFLYAYGKIQRVADALLKGKSPNVDSWHDLTIYSLMVQFSREKGTWP